MHRARAVRADGAGDVSITLAPSQRELSSEARLKESHKQDVFDYK